MARPISRAVHSAGFALLAETMLVGVVVLVASIPLVTALPAIAAGARHLRRHIDGGDDSVGALLRDVRLGMARLWKAGVALPALLGFLAFNAWFLTANPIPGGRVIAAATVVLMAGVVVVALRLAGTWDGEPLGSPQLRAAARRAGQDLPGSALLVSAVGVTGVLVWMLTPLAVVVGGLLAFAALSVEIRFVSGRTS
ncbi:hypothetical protein ACFVJS_12935 [Nocardioides sp. NPDC057772]|uniref:hypothetical protein n=1 Tax=Nocardioides sp. NPDC057772 TaxID=3346245 RepID=UPI00366FB4CA